MQIHFDVNLCFVSMYYIYKRDSCSFLKCNLKERFEYIDQSLLLEMLSEDYYRISCCICMKWSNCFIKANILSHFLFSYRGKTRKEEVLRRDHQFVSASVYKHQPFWSNQHYSGFFVATLFNKNVPLKCIHAYSCNKCQTKHSKNLKFWRQNVRNKNKS